MGPRDMNGTLIQLLVIGAIAVFLITRLMAVLGTREGFEKPQVARPDPQSRPDLTVIEGGPDRDITDHVDENSDSAKALAAMKRAEPAFNVSEFLSGARGAYEMILMGFESGNVQDLKPFLSADVFAGFQGEVDARISRGEVIDATFVGLSGMELISAEYDEASSEADLTVAFKGELTTVTRNSVGDVIAGDPNQIVKQRDVWTFSRVMGASDPNWQLVATSA